MGYRVNWKIEEFYTDSLIRIHRIFSQQPKACGFERMEDFSDFETEEEAAKEIRKRGIKKYRHCEFCWDGRVVAV